MDNLFCFIGMVLFAIFGSCVKWINETIPDVTTIEVFVVKVVTAVFVGGVTFSLYMGLEWNPWLSFAGAGCAGYLGTKGIDVVILQFFKRYKIEKTE